MSLFKQFYVLYNVYLPTDSNTTKKTVYSTIAFTVKLNIIRISALDSLVEGEQLGDFRANAIGTNADLIVEGALITTGTITNGICTATSYKVVNVPRYNKLFGRYKLSMRESA